MSTLINTKKISELGNNAALAGADLVELSQTISSTQTSTKATLLEVADFAAETGRFTTLGSQLRTLKNKVNDTVSVKDFGAVGDGVANDSAAVQAALDSGADFIEFPPGTYSWGVNDGPVIPSNVKVIGYGAVILQGNKGVKSAFNINPGTINVAIEGFDIRGPWYGLGPGLWANKTNVVTVDGDTLANLEENCGIYIRGRWYQREILGYNAAAMGALTDTSSRITIKDCRIDGFGQEAIFADRVTGFRVFNCTMTFCGRGGIRMYGIVRGYIDGNVVGNISPGWSGNYPNWNVYGITCTRMQGTPTIPDPNLTISRPTQDVSVTNNHVYNCFTWKSLDNHGSIDIRFIGNKCLNSYIGLGLDQGGTDANRGIAPPLRNIIVGNTFESNGAPYMRAGMTLYGSDSTTQANDGLVVGNNILSGYGGSHIDGAISLSNVRNAAITGNVIKGASRSGINLALMCEDVQIVGNTIEDPKSYITVAASAVGAGYTEAATSCSVSGGGGTGLVVLPNIVGGQVTTYSVIHPGANYTSAPAITVTGDGAGATATATFNVGYGVLNQGTTIRTNIDNNNFINLTQATLRAISIGGAPSGNYGVRVGSGNWFTGTMTKIYSTLANLENGSTFNRVDYAAARVTSAGAITSSFGVASVAKAGTGLYDITLDVAASAANNLIPKVDIYAATGRAFASVTSTSVIRVTTQDNAGVAADANFNFTTKNTSP